MLKTKNNLLGIAMSLFTIKLGKTGFSLDVTLDEVEDGFIHSFTGQFKKEGSETSYPKLYWQIVKMAVGIERIGNVGFALDVDGNTEPFTSLYDIRSGVYRDQVANAIISVETHLNHDLLVLNGIDREKCKHIDDDVIALAIKYIESIQTLNAGITGFFTEYNSDNVKKFVSLLLENDFETLNYGGFVSQEAAMYFRPQSALVEEE